MTLVRASHVFLIKRTGFIYVPISSFKWICDESIFMCSSVLTRCRTHSWHFWRLKGIELNFIPVERDLGITEMD